MRKLSLSLVVVAMSALLLFASPTLSYADGGGGGDTGGGGGPADQKFDHFWYDGGTIDQFGVMHPTTGWNDASMRWMLNYMNSRHPEGHLNGQDGNGELHENKYRRACAQALSNARARTGEPNARIVGIGYCYFIFDEGYNWGFSHGRLNTASKLMPRKGNASELPDRLGWSNPAKSSGVEWRQHIYNRLISDNPGTDYNLVVAAVADKEVPVNGKVRWDKNPASTVWSQ